MSPGSGATVFEPSCAPIVESIPAVARAVKRVLLLILLAAILLPSWILFQAHRQIRAVAPELPNLAAISAALVGDSEPQRISFINTASQTSPLGRLGHAGVLLEWADGRTFLIDTGMPPEQAIAFGRPIEWILDAEPTVIFGSLADQMGAGVEAIGGIAFTHLHSDHTDGLPEICERQKNPATVYQAPLQFEQLNHTTDIGFAALEAAVCPRERLAPATVMPIPGFPGLVAVSLGGHTPGSTLYVARSGGRLWMFSGDITNDKASLLGNQPKHWVYSLLVVPEDTERTSQLREWLLAFDQMDGVSVLPAHDVDLLASHFSPWEQAQ